jgi:hypothetical protein
MKNSASTYTASNVGSTPTCVARDEVGIGTHHVRELTKPKTPEESSAKHQTNQNIRQKNSARISEHARASLLQNWSKMVFISLL